MIEHRKSATRLALIGVLAFGAVQAADAAMITNWNYTANSGFTSYTGDDTAYGEPTEGTIEGSRPNSAGTTSKLTWGNNGFYSSLSVTPDSQGRLSTSPSSSATFGELVHDNQPVPALAKGLKSFVLNTNLNLVANTPSSESGFEASLENIAFHGLFSETPNDGNCVAGSQSDCDDIFVLMNENGQAVDGLSQSFIHDGYKYLVTLGIDGLGSLSDDACATAGVNAGCIGFLTQERQSNRFNRTVSISASPVANDIPEPASFGMLGLGVLMTGLGLFTRRRSGAAV